MSYPLLVIVFVALLFASIVILNKKIGTAQDRSKKRNCLKCGYDLRASKERCPECGQDSFRRLDEKKLRLTFKPLQPALPDIDDGDLTAIVHQTTEATEARLLVLQLESRNIPALKTDGNLPGQPFLILYSVQVAPGDELAAKIVVASFETSEGDQSR